MRITRGSIGDKSGGVIGLDYMELCKCNLIAAMLQMA